MTNLKKILPAFIAVAMLASCTGKEEQKVVETVEKPVVKVETVIAEEVSQLADYTATVEANKTNNITSSMPNRIKEIKVEVGDRVHAGQIVAILDDASLTQMKLRVENLKIEYDRAKELFNIGGGTKQQLDQIETEYRAQKRQYDNLVENTRLVSPISGVVTARNYDNGDMPSAAPIATVQQILPVKIVINVNEQDFTKIRKGMKMSVKCDVYGDEEFAGNVSLIYPTIDPNSRTFKVEITVNNKDGRIRPGMFARVQANYGTNTRVVVPDRAIIKQTGSGDRYVYVYKNGKVSFNKVELGQRLDNRYELMSGVETNSQVVVSGQNSIANGIEVVLSNEASK